MISKWSIIFDLDGTLVDTPRIISKALSLSIKTNTEIEVSESDIIPLIGQPLQVMIETILNEELLTAENGLVELVIRKYREYFDQIMFKLSKKDILYEGTIEMLDYLSENRVPLSIFTSKARVSANKVITHAGISKYFDEIITADDVMNHKPHHEGIDIIIKRVSSREAVMVGDSIVDIISGNRAQVLTVGVSYGVTSREDLSDVNPNFICDDVESLTRKLKEIVNNNE